MIATVCAKLGQIYSQISGIITIVAAVFVAICSIGIMMSKNQRTVEEFTMWRKRIFITWIVFFCLGALVKFGTELTEGMAYTVGQ